MPIPVLTGDVSGGNLQEYASGPDRARGSNTPDTVLLISRGTMSGAVRIAECLAQHEGVRCVTREDLVAAVNTYGEIATRIAARIATAGDAYEAFSEIRRPYRILMQRALLEYAREGRMAYFGYSGHLLVPRVAHFVRVRLIAPLEVRVARTREIKGLSEIEAREFVRRVDQERQHWARMMYGADIRDPASYDLCINVERLSLSGACDLLRKTLEETDFRPTPGSILQVEDEYLAVQAMAALVTDPATIGLEVTARASSGVVHLVGPAVADSEIGRVVAVVRSVPGVRDVEYTPGYAPAFQYAH